jgi:thioredoxin 1
MRDLEPATFNDAIREGPVVIDFWAPWCRPCLALEPALEQLSERVPVGRLNIDDYPEIASRYEVLSIPTVIFFADGAPRGKVVGVRPLAHFEGWLGEMLPAGQLDGLAVQGRDDA